MRAVLLLLTLAIVPAQTGYDLFQQALTKERAEGRVDEAIRIYEQILRDFGKDRALAARTLVRIGLCNEKLGRSDAGKSYEQVVRDYSEQHEAVEEARSRLAALSLTASSKATAMVTRQLAAGPDFRFELSISPDGRYAALPYGSLDILDLPTRNKRRIINGENAETYNAVFSADGKRIAYSWFRYGASKTDLRIVNVDGSAVRTLYQNPEIHPASVIPKAWSSDGKQIVTMLTRGDRIKQIALISVADGTIRTLKTLDWRSVGVMSFSPDNKHVAYDFSENPDTEDRDIFVLAADGSRETRVAGGRGNDVLLGWETGSNRIVFRSDRRGAIGLWSVEMSEGSARGEAQLIKADAGNIIPAGFDKKGSLYYSVASAFSDIYVVSLKTGSNEFDGEPLPIQDRLRRSSALPDWTADGKYLAYRIPRTGNAVSPSIVIREMDTGRERDITPKLRGFNSLRWSPDARSFLTIGTDLNGRYGLFVIDAQSGEVTTSLFDFYRGTWSRDGKTIFGTKSVAGETRSLVRVELGSGMETKIVSPIAGLGNIGDTALSPDGKQIAFQVSGSLRIVSTDGGESREIVRFKEGEGGVGSMAWTPGGTDLFFVWRFYEQNKYELGKVSVPDGTLQRFKIQLNNLTQLSINPAGRLTFDAGSPNYELWVMENFLPPLKPSR